MESERMLSCGVKVTPNCSKGESFQRQLCVTTDLKIPQKKRKANEYEDERDLCGVADVAIASRVIRSVYIDRHAMVELMRIINRERFYHLCGWS